MGAKTALPDWLWFPCGSECPDGCQPQSPLPDRPANSGWRCNGYLRRAVDPCNRRSRKRHRPLQLLQGAVQSSMGLGGMLSNSLFGFVAKSMGFNASFLGLSAV